MSATTCRGTRVSEPGASSLAGGVVVVVGDLILDRFVYGDVERISPEAPVPVLRRRRTRSMLGGAGNVAANIRSLGGEPRLVAVVGDDLEAEEVRRLAREGLLDVAGLVTEAGRPTSVKTRLIAHSQQVLRLDAETTDPVMGGALHALEVAFGRALEGAAAVVLSDYGKGVLRDGVAERLAERARTAGLPVLVDPKGSDYGRYCGASCVTPNRQELREATGLPVDTDAQVETAARGLIARFGFDAVIATRSEAGLSVVRAAHTVHVAAHAREVFDVSGAGDTVVAALALGLAAGHPAETAARLANAAAGVAVSKLGTAQVTTGELAEALADGAVPAAGDAEALLARWRGQGLRVGFTNGCFDLLHPGHLSLLRFARSVCDRLVVGLNSDASVRRLKGPTRPVNDVGARREVLEGLRDVDLVISFEEDTPELLIRRVAPDVLVKGADYAEHQVVGAEIVRSRGGEVRLAPLVPGRSTTATIGRLSSG